jgi:serine acetyltransferase
VSEVPAGGVAELRSLKRALEQLWLFSPERLWLLSIALHRRGRRRLAFAVKQLNTIVYHNSLSPAAVVGADVLLGHYSHGIVVNSNVEIGDRVKIWHNVTLTAGRVRRGEDERSAVASRIVIEDGVRIGTNAVVIAPRGECLRIGRGARIGAGAIVTQDVPARATVVSPPARILLREESEDADAAAADVLSAGSRDAALEPDASLAPSGEDAKARRTGTASQQP